MIRKRPLLTSTAFDFKDKGTYQEYLHAKPFDKEFKEGAFLLILFNYCEAKTFYTPEETSLFCAFTGDYVQIQV